MQGHAALNVLVIQRGVVVLTLEGAVPVVLDAIVCAPWQQLGNHRPLVAVCLSQATPQF